MRLNKTIPTPVPIPPIPAPDIIDNPKLITSLTDALYQLESRGLLQPYNRLTLEDIINPPFELFMAGDTSDEEIYRAVKEMRRIERESDGDGASGEGDGRPTRKEALMASFVVQRYLLDVNAPFARGLEGALSDFGRGGGYASA
ncbi:hypothetical protein BDQ17DRAFT_1427825 [Cyathus striatus]|nr:hypothetical protein BDQ17DRAFT_1427825 [Cyathus striatus]